MEFSRKGYYREQFEQAWQRYCPAKETSKEKVKTISTKKAKRMKAKMVKAKRMKAKTTSKKKKQQH